MAMSEEGCWCQMFSVAVHQVPLIVAAESPHLPGGTVPLIRHRAPRTSQTNPTREWFQFQNSRGLGHVMQRDDASVYGWLL